MNVCLLFPPVFLPIAGLRATPPLGVHLLRDVLRQCGHEASLLYAQHLAVDCADRHSLVERGFLDNQAFLKAISDCDLLALSCDSFNYPIGRIAIANAKSLRPDLPVCIGGVHSTLLPEYLVQTSGADYILCGEGEESLPLLLAAIEQGRGMDSVPGLAWKLPSGEIAQNPQAPLISPEKLARWGQADVFDADMSYYTALPVETSRGCPYRCQFCSVVHKGKWRPLPAEVVIERIDQVACHSRRILLVDDSFTISIRRAEAILKHVATRYSDVHLSFEARANNLVDPRLLYCLPPERILRIQIGAESGYPEGLARLDKRVRLDQIETACRHCEAAGLSGRMMASFIIGLPWETARHCLATLEFAKSLEERFGTTVVINWWIPTPSVLWNEFRTRGVFGPAMYDDPDWVRDRTIFKNAHPGLKPGDRERLDFLIMSRQQSGPRGLPTRAECDD